MADKMPDFAEMVKKELNLTPQEADEFLKLEVAHLASEVDTLALNFPGVGLLEQAEIKNDLEKSEMEYHRLLGNASGRVRQAMERYFELNLEWLNSNGF